MERSCSTLRPRSMTSSPSFSTISNEQGEAAPRLSHRAPLPESVPLGISVQHTTRFTAQCGPSLRSVKGTLRPLSTTISSTPVLTFLREPRPWTRPRLQKAPHRGENLLSSRVIVSLISAVVGGMALYLTRQHDVSVQGITLSQEQLAVAQSRAETDDLSDKVLFELRDYRDLHGSFDRIVSVGMFEHVGAQNFGKFFRQVKSLLAEDGVALLHTIGRFSSEEPTLGFAAAIFWRLYPGTLRNYAHRREKRADRHRCRSFANPLC